MISCLLSLDHVLGYNPMLNWAFRTTESVLKNAVTLSAPFVHKFDTPICFVDQQFVKTLDKIEQKAPIIREQPGEIYTQAKAKVMDVVQPQIDRVCVFRKSGERKAASLKELSYNKAKEVLATSYGAVCVSGIDSTAVLAERLLDSFFPGTNEDEKEDDNSEWRVATIYRIDKYKTKKANHSIFLEPISASEDPVLHTVQTIGRLNNKVARRVYRSISRQIQKLRKEDLTDYVASLIAVLRLTQYLNFLHLSNAQQQQGSIPAHQSNQGIIVKWIIQFDQLCKISSLLISWLLMKVLKYTRWICYFWSVHY